MPFAIRPYQAKDLRALYEVCLKTGDSGQDATALYRDPDLLGHVYAGPYGVLAPETCFVVADEHDAACGYILGTAETESFANRCEREWFPALRARYPIPTADDQSPDARMIRAIHRGLETVNEFPDYPAHLHIDLVPIAQGQGWGRKLMTTLVTRLRELNAPGVHLGVGARNTNAIAFYERMGFHRLATYEWGIVYGMTLTSPSSPARP